MNKLFDQNPDDEKPDDELKHDEEEDDEIVDESNSKIFNRDKIFDNDYNTGNLDFEEYANIPKVDVFYEEENLKEYYDSFEYHRNLELQKLVDEFFKNTEYGKAFATKKKLPKQVLPTVFVSMKEQFKGRDFTDTEIFTGIADYFGINYEVLYENIPSVYRADLVKELDDKYGILKRKGVKRLF